MTKTTGAIAILGGRGMLGTDLALACERSSISYRIFDLPDFDITDTSQLTEAVNACDLIINCAAYTNVDGAEAETELAYKVNAQAVGQLGYLAAEQNKYVLHISTDFVFDGKQDKAYIETDKPNPINEYGRSKLAGEQALLESGCCCGIIRVEWTYGKAGNNFVKKLLKLAEKLDKLKVVVDQVGSPTSTREVAETMCEFIEKRPEGLFHFAANGYVSRYDMAAFVFEKLDMDINMESCKSSDFVCPAARPLNSRFCCDKIAAVLNEPIRPWQEPLEEYLRDL
jgi:dTDP-4-dehydrorhamnose reductase